MITIRELLEKQVTLNNESKHDFDSEHHFYWLYYGRMCAFQNLLTQLPDHILDGAVEDNVLDEFK